MEDTKEIRAAAIKAATLEMINAAWSQNRYDLTDKNATHVPTLEQKITRLAGNNLLPHIRLHKTEGVCLLSSFIEMLKENHRITRISMEQLAVICGWTYKPVRLGDEGSSKTVKVVRVPLDRFVAFLTDGSTQAALA